MPEALITSLYIGYLSDINENSLHPVLYHSITKYFSMLFVFNAICIVLCFTYCCYEKWCIYLSMVTQLLTYIHRIYCKSMCYDVILTNCVPAHIQRTTNSLIVESLLSIVNGLCQFKKCINTCFIETSSCCHLFASFCSIQA